MRGKKYSPVWTFIALAILALFIVFVVYPLVLVLYKSVINPSDNSFTMENFTRFFSRKYYTNTLKNSFKVTVVATLISATLGLTIAYITKQYKIRFSSTLNIAIVLSYLSPPFIGAYAWIQLLGRKGIFTNIINKLPGVNFEGIYGFAGIVLVFSLQSFPLVYMYVCGALENLDNSLNEAAESLGANNVQRVTGIILPLVLPTVLASSLLVFMRVFSDFGTPMLIGEGYRTFPVVLYNQFMGGGYKRQLFRCCALCYYRFYHAVFLLPAAICFRKAFLFHVGTEAYAAERSEAASEIFCHLFVYLVVLIALLPQITVIVTSFLKESTPGIFTNEFSLINYKTIFSKNPLVIPNTYLFGLCAIALVIVFGVLIAFLAVRRKSLITSTLDTLTMLPYIIPGSVLGICFLYAFAKRPLALTGTAWIIIIALTVRRMPYTIRSSTAIISQISPSIEEAAISLGASEFRSFEEVTLPMMLPGVISGAIMSWVTVISELSSSIMLYRANTQTLTVSVYTEVIRDCFGNAAAYSTVLTVTSVLSMLLFFKLTGRRNISV